MSSSSVRQRGINWIKVTGMPVLLQFKKTTLEIDVVRGCIVLSVCRAFDPLRIVSTVWCLGLLLLVYFWWLSILEIEGRGTEWSLRFYVLIGAMGVIVSTAGVASGLLSLTERDLIVIGRSKWSWSNSGLWGTRVREGLVDDHVRMFIGRDYGYGEVTSEVRRVCICIEQVCDGEVFVVFEASDGSITEIENVVRDISRVTGLRRGNFDSES